MCVGVWCSESRAASPHKELVTTLGLELSDGGLESLCFQLLDKVLELLL